MTTLSPEIIKARVAAGLALSASAGRASESFDKLASWFLAGFGAGLALALTQLKNESQLISAQVIETEIYVFICACVLCLAQRYVGIVVQGGAFGTKDGNEIGEKLRPFDVQEFISQMKAGSPWIIRKMAATFWDASLKGDFSAGGRLLIRLVLVQGLLATLEVALLLIALGQFANRLDS